MRRVTTSEVARTGPALHPPGIPALANCPCRVLQGCNTRLALPFPLEPQPTDRKLERVRRRFWPDEYAWDEHGAVAMGQTTVAQCDACEPVARGHRSHILVDCAI